eukprot:gene5427-3912_t
MITPYSIYSFTELLRISGAFFFCLTFCEGNWAARFQPMGSDTDTSPRLHPFTQGSASFIPLFATSWSTAKARHFPAHATSWTPIASQSSAACRNIGNRHLVHCILCSRPRTFHLDVLRNAVPGRFPSKPIPSHRHMRTILLACLVVRSPHVHERGDTQVNTGGTMVVPQWLQRQLHPHSFVCLHTSRREHTALSGFS